MYGSCKYLLYLRLRHFISKGSEWKEKAESLEVELQQCYKAQARLSEQLVVEVADSRVSKALVQEKEALISDLQNELSLARFCLDILSFCSLVGGKSYFQ